MPVTARHLNVWGLRTTLHFNNNTSMAAVFLAPEKAFNNMAPGIAA
jgi:hypothetical protein